MQTVKLTEIQLVANAFDGKYEPSFKGRKRDANLFPQERLSTVALSQLNPIRDFHIQVMAERKNLGTIVTEPTRNLLK